MPIIYAYIASYSVHLNSSNYANIWNETVMKALNKEINNK